MSKKLIYSQEDLDLILELEKVKEEELQQENKQLKDNWNKLKDYIISTRYEYGDLDQDLEDYNLEIEDVLNKMQELEKGSDKDV